MTCEQERRGSEADGEPGPHGSNREFKEKMNLLNLWGLDMAVESAVITVKESWKGETCQVIIHFTVSRIEEDISLDAFGLTREGCIQSGGYLQRGDFFLWGGGGQ